MESNASASVGGMRPNDADPSREERFHRITDILRCKWMVMILDAVDRGVNRPGRLERAIDGLTPKVLHDRVDKLLRWGILERHAFAEIPPRVEYTFTEHGRRLLGLVRTVREFVDAWDE